MRTDIAFSSAVAITPSDTAAQNYASVYVGGTGDVTYKAGSATAVTFKAVPVGTVLPMPKDADKVMATGTTATLLVGLLP